MKYIYSVWTGDSLSAVLSESGLTGAGLISEQPPLRICWIRAGLICVNWSLVSDEEFSRWILNRSSALKQACECNRIHTETCKCTNAQNIFLHEYFISHHSGAAALIITCETLVFTVCWIINSTHVRWQVLFRCRVSLEKLEIFIMIKNKLDVRQHMHYKFGSDYDCGQMKHVCHNIHQEK